VLRRGKPVRAAFNYVFSFDPRLYSDGHYWREEAPEENHASQEELRRILSGCAEYCRKLARSAFDYICEETIREIRRQLLVGLDRSSLTAAVTQQEMIGPGLEMATRRNIQIFDSSRTEINDYSCDYQLIKKMDRIEERRILLKENGRKITDQIKLLEEKRYSVLRPIFESLQILDQDHQPQFNYNILEEERVHGKKAFVIKATPRSGDADGVRSAKIWVDKASFQIPKSEIEGIPLEGYDDVLKDAIRLNIDPVFVTTHEYQIEKSGVLFPDSTSVRVDYRGLYPGARPVLKLKVDLTYKKFKFFTVETEHQIIK
jgi:hypothetical protein